jgi:hypothetical protein
MPNPERDQTLQEVDAGSCFANAFSDVPDTRRLSRLRGAGL